MRDYYMLLERKVSNYERYRKPTIRQIKRLAYKVVKGFRRQKLNNAECDDLYGRLSMLSLRIMNKVG